VEAQSHYPLQDEERRGGEKGKGGGGREEKGHYRSFPMARRVGVW